MTSFRFGPIRVTEQQHLWLSEQCNNTGNNIASVVRSLIQYQINHPSSHPGEFAALNHAPSTQKK